MKSSQCYASREEKIQLWSTRISNCKSSGLTVAAWCSQNDVPIRSYWYWHKIVKSTSCETPAKPTNEIYEISDAAVAQNKVVATIRKGELSIDVYTEESSVIASACKALSAC